MYLKQKKPKFKYNWPTKEELTEFCQYLTAMEISKKLNIPYKTTFFHLTKLNLKAIKHTKQINEKSDKSI